jgi:hypothetical protein
VGPAGGAGLRHPVLPAVPGAALPGRAGQEPERPAARTVLAEALHEVTLWFEFERRGKLRRCRLRKAVAALRLPVEGVLRPCARPGGQGPEVLLSSSPEPGDFLGALTRLAP